MQTTRNQGKDGGQNDDRVGNDLGSVYSLGRLQFKCKTQWSNNVRVSQNIWRDCWEYVKLKSIFLETPCSSLLGLLVKIKYRNCMLMSLYPNIAKN